MSRKPIEPGCAAIVVGSVFEENNFKIVKVGKYIGSIKGFKGYVLWEVSQPLRYGLKINIDFFEHHNFCPEPLLQRIDDNDEDELTEQLIEEEDNV